MGVMCDAASVFCRDSEGNDSRYKPGNVNVLGDITLDCHGDNGQLNFVF